MTRLAALLFACLCSAGGAHALTLELPAGARETVARITGPDSYRAPLSVFEEGGVEMLSIEGRVARRAWRIARQGLTTLQVMRPLRAQLEELGFRPVFECNSDACGGFDFRFEIEVLPGPNMYVNLGRFRFLTAIAGPLDRPDALVTVLVSATTASSYVQIVHVDAGSLGAGDASAAPASMPADVSAPLPSDPRDAASDSDTQMLRQLEAQGFAVLDNLDFATGSTALGAGPFPSLEALARALTARPDWRVALVGHTDTVGGLEPNIALSRARAEAVRARLIEAFGIAPGRLDAEGMGYLAPLATNLTSEGRADNRRVEVIVLNTE
jgi:OOP family OmpA-OmpF porin